MRLSTIALIVIDVQIAFAHMKANKVPRSTPMAEANIARLMAAFRNAGGMVCHVHHHSLEDGSPFEASLPGAKVQDFAAPLKDEALYIKHVNSGFIGTKLEADLRSQGIRHLVLCGGTANHCVETTTRMAGNLGFDSYYVADGVWAYGNKGPDGKAHSPDDVLSMSIGNLHGEFATVVSTDEVLEMLAGM